MVSTRPQDLESPLGERENFLSTVVFKVVNMPRDFDSEYKLLNTTTGRDFGMMFTEDDATYLFKT